MPIAPAHLPIPSHCPAALTKPEYWRVDGGGDGVAVLDIPGLMARSRVFDVDVSLWVRVPQQASACWHELVVEFGGQRQWGRRIASQNPAQTDGLEYHQRVVLEPEQSLRVRAWARVGGVQVQQLLIEAREALLSP